MDNGPGWLPDPEHEGQERYWDGSDWTDQVRPAASVGLPEHVPELQRALAAATAEIDAVEDRLSSLFDRTGTPGGAGAVHRAQARPPGAAADDDDDEGEVEEVVDEAGEDDEFDDEGAYEFVDEDEDDEADDEKAEEENAEDDEFDDEDAYEFADEDEAGDDGEEDAADEGVGVVSAVREAEDATEDEDDADDAFAELDAALAAEAPDTPERRFFRRKS